MTVAIGALTGVLTGLASAALFWWWQAKLTRPKIGLCPVLAHYRLRGDQADRYQYKITNKGSRPVADIRVTVVARMPGLITAESTSLYVLHQHEVPWLDKGGSTRFRINPGRLLERNENVSLGYFPSEMAALIRSAGELDLPLFMGLCPQATIQIIVAAVDALTGAQKRDYHIYSADDVRTGSFTASADCDLVAVLDVEASYEDGAAHKTKSGESPVLPDADVRR